MAKSIATQRGDGLAVSQPRASARVAMS